MESTIFTNFKLKVMWKQCDVVLLSTNNADNCLILYDKRNNPLVYERGYFTKEYLESINAKAFYIYILSDDEVKNEDYVYPEKYSHIWKYRKAPCPMPYWGNPNGCKKLIATNEVSKHLSLLSIEIINIIVDAYNKSETHIIGVDRIKKVMVEYEEFDDPVDKFGISNPKIVKPKIIEGCINIKFIKNSWSRDELFDLCWNARLIEFSSNTTINKKILKDYIDNL
jgi:hypothetical protein